MLGPNGQAIVLYQVEQNKGHWVGIHLTIDDANQEIIEVFDPYGTPIDFQFRHYNLMPQRRNLSRILLNSARPVHYNEFPFQSVSPAITTCGRHVLFRQQHTDKTLKEYQNFLLFLMHKYGVPNLDALMVNLIKM